MYVINGMCGGSAQPDFYLTFKLTDKILVILRNLRGYDITRVSVKHFNKIEKQNNINFNVFNYEEKKSFPIYIS